MPTDPDTPAETSSATPPQARRTGRAVGDRGMQRATVVAVLVGLVLDLAVIAVAATRDESSALVGALIGTGLTLVIVVPSVAITYAGPRLTPVSMAAAVLGSWAAKMLIVILVLVLVRDTAAVSTLWIGLALLVGAVSAVLVEAILLVRTRQPLSVAPVHDASENPGRQEGQ
ncbi:hypothetical protein [Brachybacterium sp. YJGR34]|uniref:hypothetical protein n=1 Tax=Brachybacterium sp. YJGR34 TaxID=2059911 RepID=UPI000E0AE225|nr:hypothetical protein [Brachybacterium sp. YJGR34]